MSDATDYADAKANYARLKTIYFAQLQKKLDAGQITQQAFNDALQVYGQDLQDPNTAYDPTTIAADMFAQIQNIPADLQDEAKKAVTQVQDFFATVAKTVTETAIRTGTGAATGALMGFMPFILIGLVLILVYMQGRKK